MLPVVHCRISNVYFCQSTGTHCWRLSERQMMPMVQARNVLPGHLGPALSALLKEEPAEPQEGAKQWAAHIAATADGAMQAAEASFGIEGVHDAALARAEALVMATDGFTAQVELPATLPHILQGGEGALKPCFCGLPKETRMRMCIGRTRCHLSCCLVIS